VEQEIRRKEWFGVQGAGKRPDGLFGFRVKRGAEDE
jgi:hypothetical protein